MFLQDIENFKSLILQDKCNIEIFLSPERERDTCEQSLHSSLILSSALRDTSTDLYKPEIKDIIIGIQ